MLEIKLGLIGVGIGKSRAPELHRLAGRLCELAVTYDLIEPPVGVPYAFDEALQACRGQGYRGVNVTYPFKEQRPRRCRPRPIRCGDSVRSTPCASMTPQPRGFNTDYTGFRRAFCVSISRTQPRSRCDRRSGRSRPRDRGLRWSTCTRARSGSSIRTARSRPAWRLRCGNRPRRALRFAGIGKKRRAAAEGLINATPLGMHQHPGTPIPRILIGTQAWAFDAIYTPTDTRFLLDAAAAGLEVLYGYELFFYQGVDAFEIFTGMRGGRGAPARGAELASRGPLTTSELTLPPLVW